MGWITALPLVLALAAQPGAVPERPAPRFRTGAAFLQLGTLLALDAGWYEWQIELNKQDFDFARTFAGQWRRLATPAGHRFDDNERYLNVGHAFFGAIYYQTARANGGSMAASYLFNIGASTLWEAGVEHREVISVNDQLVTGLAGAPIGEALYRVGDVFARGKPTFRNRLLMGLVSPMRLPAWLMGEGPQASGLYDRHGLDASVVHRFDLALGGTAGVANGSAPAADGAWVGTARMDLEVIALPLLPPPDAGEERDDGQHTTSHLRGGEISRFVVDYAGTGRDLRAFDLAARTTLFGSFDGRRATRRDGGAARTRVLGAASAFELAYDTAGGLTDFVTLAHLIGPTGEVAWSRDQLALRAELSAYGDFAMIRPMAIGTGVAPGLIDGAKSTLQRFAYYYGWGGTVALRLEMATGAFRSGIAAEWNHVDSIEGLDRHQEAYVSPTSVLHPAITDDSNLTDDRLKARAFLEAPVPFIDIDGLRLGIAGDLTHRRGTWAAHDLDHAQDDLRVAVTVTMSL
jgi:Domain of unknown function (DUF3943)